VTEVVYRMCVNRLTEENAVAQLQGRLDVLRQELGDAREAKQQKRRKSPGSVWALATDLQSVGICGTDKAAGSKVFETFVKSFA
jgi:hypothetical protein